MLWFPLMVNSTRVGTVEVLRRKEEGTPLYSGEHTYDWTVKTEPKVIEMVLAEDAGITLVPSVVGSGELTHLYEDGGFELMRKVLNAYAGL